MSKNLIAFFAIMAIAVIASTGFVLARQSQATSEPESSTSMQTQCPCQGAGLDCHCTDNGQPCACGQAGGTCSCGKSANGATCHTPVAN